MPRDEPNLRTATINLYAKRKGSEENDGEDYLIIGK